MQLLNLIPSHKVALWLVEHIDNLLDRCGLMRYPTLEQAIYLIIVVFIALGVGLAVRHAVVWIVRKIGRLRGGELGRQLLQQRVIQKCSHFIPPLVFMGMVPFAFDSQSPLMHAVDKGVLIYAIVAIAYGVAAVLKFVFQQVNSRRNTRNLPVQGVLNVVLGILWIIVAIVCVSVLVDKSPGTLLAGLTAFAAALMLIFKDSILGFVAVPLSTVKIRNFDNTLVMVPPYELVSKGFQNFRAMQDTGARRIMVDVTIGTDCVQPLTPDRIAALVKKYPALQEFTDRAAKTSDGWICDNGSYEVNGTTETNLGLFRAYATTYLKSNPHMSKDQMMMVRLQPPTPNGYVLQFYCFTNTSAWVAYEAILSSLLEHLTMAMRDFGLDMYSASDLSVDLTRPS